MFEMMDVSSDSAKEDDEGFEDELGEMEYSEQAVPVK
jgi:hypothetical protein